MKLFRLPILLFSIFATLVLAPSQAQAQDKPCGKNKAYLCGEQRQCNLRELQALRLIVGDGGKYSQSLADYRCRTVSVTHTKNYKGSKRKQRCWWSQTRELRIWPWGDSPWGGFAGAPRGCRWL